MAGHRFTSRLPVLALVAAAHLAGLLLLVILTRTQLVRSAEEESLVVMLLPAGGAASSARAPPRRRAMPPAGGASAAPPEAEAAVPPGAAPLSAEERPAPDWADAAHAAAERQIDAEERARRQAAAFGPRHSDAFKSPRHKPEFHWDYARTHRVEPLKGGLGVAVNLNDHCALILFALIPMAGCTIGEIPVRGDLFDHMHDPPEPGAWQER